jgi:hypothetical protein
MLELLPWSDTKPKPTSAALAASKTTNLNIFPFHWTGSTVFSGTLKPEEGLMIKAFATFQLPGVYDVNRWKLTVRCVEGDKEEGEVFVHQPTLPQLITTTAIEA